MSNHHRYNYESALRVSTRAALRVSTSAQHYGCQQARSTTAVNKRAALRLSVNKCAALRLSTSAQHYGCQQARSTTAVNKRAALRLSTSAQHYGCQQARSTTAVNKRAALRLSTSAHFNSTYIETEYKLYCMSLYGSVLWDFSTNVNVFNTAWRKSIGSLYFEYVYADLELLKT